MHSKGQSEGGGGAHAGVVPMFNWCINGEQERKTKDICSIFLGMREPKLTPETLQSVYMSVLRPSMS